MLRLLPLNNLPPGLYHCLNLPLHFTQHLVQLLLLEHTQELESHYGVEMEESRRKKLPFDALSVCSLYVVLMCGVQGLQLPPVVHKDAGRG